MAKNASAHAGDPWKGYFPAGDSCNDINTTLQVRGTMGEPASVVFMEIRSKRQLLRDSELAQVWRLPSSTVDLMLICKMPLEQPDKQSINAHRVEIKSKSSLVVIDIKNAQLKMKPPILPTTKNIKPYQITYSVITSPNLIPGIDLERSVVFALLYLPVDRLIPLDKRNFKITEQANMPFIGITFEDNQTSARPSTYPHVPLIPKIKHVHTPTFTSGTTTDTKSLGVHNNTVTYNAKMSQDSSKY